MDNQQTPQVPQEQNKEDAQVEKIKRTYEGKFLDSPKFQEWYRLFYDKKNKETFGNSTRSAIQAYNLDEETQYSVAGAIGSQNLKKLKNVGRDILLKKGVTYSSMLDIGFNKMLKANNPDLWFMFMEVAGFPVPEFKPVTNATFVMNQVNNQVNNGTMSVTMIQDDPEENKQIEGQDFTFDGETKDNAVEGVEVKEENVTTDQTNPSPVPNSDGQDTV